MLYICKGYYLDDQKEFEDAIISDGSWDGNNDEDIFYYTDGEPVEGFHDDFFITHAEPIKLIKFV